MDRRTVAAIVLALGVYYVWITWMRVRYPPPPEGEQALVEATEPAPVLAPPPVPVAPVAPVAEPVRTLPFEACGAEAVWSTDGGVLSDIRLPGYEAPYHVTAIWQYVWGRVTGGIDGSWKPYGDEPGVARLVSDKGRLLAMGTGDLQAVAPRVEVVTGDLDHVVLRGVTPDGVEVTREVRAKDDGKDHCLLEVTSTWRNVGSTPFAGDLWLAMHDHLRATEGRYDNLLRPHGEINGKDRSIAKLEKMDEPQTWEGPVGWFALADRYFAVVLLPADGATGKLWFTPQGTGPDGLHGLHYVVPATLAPGAAHTETFTAYIGPKEFGTLSAIDPRLKDLVPLGFFAFFGRILLWLLVFFHGYVGNWGLAIILLTVAIKALFYPLTQASFRSSQAMQNLQPELQQVRESLKDNPQELNRRTMELFRERGVNPLGGCLPMLVQLPVWIALYQVLLNSVELYHTEFFYLRDLSSVDPYSALPLVVVALMLVQQQFMPTGNMDPAQARMMKWMPLIFGVFFFTFPSGLVVYIFVNMVLTILQQWMIKRSYQQPAVAAVAS